MDIKKSFKEEFTFEERLVEARKRKIQFPDLIPLIITLDNRSKLPLLEKER